MNEKQVIRTADRLFVLGRRDEALLEYQKLLAVGPRDERVLQALGDCHVVTYEQARSQHSTRNSDPKQAEHFFTRVAESYRSGGFLLQAEVFYEKVLEYSPDRVDIHRELAALQRELGLTSESAVHERIAASRQAPLPEEVASKLNQAEWLVRKGRKEEALQELARLAEDLERHERMEEWRRVAERLNQLQCTTRLSNALALHYLREGNSRGVTRNLPFPLDAVDDEEVEAQLKEGHSRLLEERKRIRASTRRAARTPYDEALRKYEAEAPKDFRVLQELAELYREQGDLERAVHFLTLAAGCHEADGFLLQAVACHERVLYLIPMPRQVDPGRDLIRLHQALGVELRLMQPFPNPAAHDEGTGENIAPARRVWVSTEPEIKQEDIARAERTRETARRLLAEARAKEARREAPYPNAPAGDSGLVSYLQHDKRKEDWLHEAEQRFALEPENAVLARQLARQYLLRGEPARALSLLEGAARAGETDIETLTLKAEAHEVLGQPEKAAPLFEELVRTGAARRFARSVEDFQRDHRLEDWLHVAARLNALVPWEQSLAAELAHEVLRRGQHRSIAVALVREVFPSDGSTGALLSLLYDHFERLGQREKFGPIRNALDDMTAGMFRV